MDIRIIYSYPKIQNITIPDVIETVWIEIFQYFVISQTIIVLIIPQNMTPCMIFGLSSSLRIIKPARKKRAPNAMGNNLSDRQEASRSLTRFNLIKARIVMIDCDLKESARLALEFIKPAIQEGTIILFDDYVFFKGNIEKGEYGAFKDFQKKYPEIVFRRIFDYGYGSRAFIVHKIN